MPIPSTPGANHDPEQRDLDPSEVCTLPPDGLAERMAWIHKEIAEPMKNSTSSEAIPRTMSNTCSTCMIFSSFGVQ